MNRNEFNERIFQKYDKLNALWTEAESLICSQHVPREIHYMYADGNYIGVAKINGEWRLCHSRFGGEVKPIVECSGAVRVEAARHFCGFHCVLIENMKVFLGEAEQAILNLNDFLHPL